MKKIWDVKRIGELCNLSTGGTPSRRNPEYFSKGTIKWLVSGDIHKGEIFDCEGRITEDAMKNSNAKFLPLNSVLIALNGQGKTRGAVALLRTEATCNQSLVSIYPKDIKTIIPEYLYCYLHSKYYEIRKITGDGGNDRRGLNMSLIRNIEIPLPPLLEQQRVVTILDEVLANISKAKDNAEQNLKNAKEIFESYLQSVFSNKSDRWEEEPLGDVCDTGAGGTPLKSHKDYYDNGDIPWLRSGEVDKKDITQCELYITPKGLKNSSARLFPMDTVLIAMYGATAGQVGILRFECSTNQAVCGILPNKNFIPEFLYYKFLAGKDALVKQAVGGAQPNISQIKIRNTRVPVILVKEQQIIVKKLDTLSSETKRLEAIYELKLQDLEELKKSILQKAFNGEL